VCGSVAFDEVVVDGVVDVDEGVATVAVVAVCELDGAAVPDPDELALELELD
jgi:hypothetical protein